MSSDRTTTRLLALAAPLMVKALHYAFCTIAARKRRKTRRRHSKSTARLGVVRRRQARGRAGPARRHGLHVVFDFDRTLTAHDAPQCHDPLLRLEDEKLQAALAPYWRFSDEGGPPPCRDRPFRCWWDDVHALPRGARRHAGPVARGGGQEAVLFEGRRAGRAGGARVTKSADDGRVRWFRTCHPSGCCGQKVWRSGQCRSSTTTSPTRHGRRACASWPTAS